MMTTLEERKTKLLSQIEKLNREIDISKLPEQNDLASCRGMGSVRYPNLDRLWKNSKI
jgi:hypothetical protein